VPIFTFVGTGAATGGSAAKTGTVASNNALEIRKAQPNGNKAAFMAWQRGQTIQQRLK
jgi:hypothetical protein